MSSIKTPMAVLALGLAAVVAASCDSPTEPTVGLSFEWEGVPEHFEELPPAEVRMDGGQVIVTGVTRTSDSCSDPTALLREGTGFLLELHEEYSGRPACLPSVQHHQFRAEFGPVDREVVFLTVFYFKPDESQILLDTILGLPEP